MIPVSDLRVDLVIFSAPGSWNSRHPPLLLYIILLLCIHPHHRDSIHHRELLYAVRTSCIDMP